MEMNATEVRQRFLALLDDLPEEGIVITRRGTPMAKIVPIRAPRKGRYVQAPLLRGSGKPGPIAPTTENLYDLIFE